MDAAGKALGYFWVAQTIVTWRKRLGCHICWAQRKIFCKGPLPLTTNDETETDLMQGYKEPSFNERVAAANKAKAKALEMLKNKPKPSEAEIAERTERRRAKETAEAEKRAAAEAARQAKKAAKEPAAREAAEAAEAAARPKLPTAEELKAARDARYAARKARQR